MPPPTINRVDHQSAVDHPLFVTNYIRCEVSKGASIGPFKCIPFSGTQISVSPLSTRPKKDTEERTILDLSYPKGASVNDWTPKDNYLGFQVNLVFPGVDDLAE